MHPADALKYAAAQLTSCTDWATDSIAGSDCGHAHEAELDAINDAVTKVQRLAAQFGDRNGYSDGRLITSSARIDNGVATMHVWYPDPAQEEPRSWRGVLPHDPGTPCPGLYEVTTSPATQDIHVRVVRAA